MNLLNNKKHIPLSIISPAYNNGEELEGLLDSLKDDFKRNPLIEMIVVDDCSTDDSVAKTVEKFSFVKFIRLPQNKGAAAARNIGAMSAIHPVLIFIDSDGQVEPDTIKKTEEVMCDEKIKIMIGNESKIPLNNGIYPAYRAIMHNSWAPRGKFATFITGGFAAIRKEVFDGFGRFDERYKGGSVEDFEFGHRLSEKYPICFFKDILIRVNWSPFGKTMKTHYSRTILWMQLLKRRKKFDNFCTTSSQGAGYVLGFLSLVFFPFIFLGNGLPVLPLTIIFLYLLFNRRFFLLAKREKGIVFMFMAVIIHLAEAMVITIASVVGLFTNPLTIPKGQEVTLT